MAGVPPSPATRDDSASAKLHPSSTGPWTPLLLGVYRDHMRSRCLGVLVLLLAAACGSGGGSTHDGGQVTPDGGAAVGSPYGPAYEGQYNLGPVDWAETQWTNACSPYPAPIQALEGNLLAGLANGHAGDGSLCDACVYLTTPAGRSVFARVVTYGVTQGPNDIDLSQPAYDALNTGEYPRAMTWQLAKCGGSGVIYYQLQTGANEWWTSLWVRNARLPVTKLEVMSANHGSWSALERGTDGTFTDGSGFGAGSFTLRVTADDGQQVTDTFVGFDPGALLPSSGQFQ
jgi:expansin